MSTTLSATALARLLGIWNNGTGPAYRELADVVRLLILDGRVALDSALPSERSLCAVLGISRTTVTAAYSSLRDQGFLYSRQGSRARTCIPQLAPFGRPRFAGEGSTGPTDGERNSTPGGPRAGAGARERRQADPDPDPARIPAPVSTLSAPGLVSPEGLIDLAYAALPASGELVHRAFAAAVTELPALLPGFGYDAVGLLPLRQAIADRYTAAGVPTDPANILVTSGAQHALTLVIRTLADRQDRVLVEHPSYPNALDAIHAAGCRPVPVAFTDGGWDLPALESALAQQRPRMAYLVPDFHNPTGMVMSDLERRRLLRATATSGTVPVVDETLRELNLDGIGTTHMAGFSPSVITIGSLSKSHWGGLRTGWIRASRPMIQRLAATRTTVDLGGPIMEQLAAAHLVRALDEPLPARLDMLRRNRAALLELLGTHLPEWEVAPPAGGLSVWCRLPAPSSTALAALAPEYGIRLAAGPRFGIGGAFERHLRVPFTLPPGKLEAAVMGLRAAQDRLDAAPQLRRTLKKAPAMAIA
ncbi:PLP-dependent aminotransferase family protein [Arthrobacter sp. NQ7]|uniref:MocR-like transcription factor YczR n=1 Tax=Arthrobacter sp. NQ7 TaxID=3032303 RepID=UPI0024105F56|nr:PLP-dependent aminotransferase family protein [Arthrobacter sp. NQ7]MDJ0458071.1 PLP-dependent aminotransferase family protein [Arthrobacter sp. NQ7]